MKIAIAILATIEILLVIGLIIFIQQISSFLVALMCLVALA